MRGLTEKTRTIQRKKGEAKTRDSENSRQPPVRHKVMNYKGDRQVTRQR